jgi:hypothetical protein
MIQLTNTDNTPAFVRVDKVVTIRTARNGNTIVGVDGGRDLWVNNTPLEVAEKLGWVAA